MVIIAAAVGIVTFALISKSGNELTDGIFGRKKENNTNSI